MNQEGETTGNRSPLCSAGIRGAREYARVISPEAGRASDTICSLISVDRISILRIYSFLDHWFALSPEKTIAIESGCSHSAEREGLVLDESQCTPSGLPKLYECTTTAGM